jgi:hypothetical protein
MINLEELTLYLLLKAAGSTYIDGIELYDEILIDKLQLKKFSFSIKTLVINKNISIDLPSNEDIQRSFIGRGYGQIGSYIHTRSMGTEGRCHVYSLPYEFEYFIDLDLGFPGGMFHKVRYLLMIDKRPFEHDFFEFISHEFPFLEHLYICNDEPQQNKQSSSTLITFPHLTLLNLQMAHTDYAEQFLLERNAYLPRLAKLFIKYKLLSMVKDKSIVDCSGLVDVKREDIFIHGLSVQPEHFGECFPFF